MVVEARQRYTNVERHLPSTPAILIQDGGIPLEYFGERTLLDLTFKYVGYLTV